MKETLVKDVQIFLYKSIPTIRAEAREGLMQCTQYIRAYSVLTDRTVGIFINQNSLLFIKCILVVFPGRLGQFSLQYFVFIPLTSLYSIHQAGPTCGSCGLASSF